MNKQDKPKTKKNSKLIQNLVKTNYHEEEYFIAGPNKEADMMASAKITKELHKKYNEVFTEIGCFEGTFSLEVKEGMKPYQAPPRCMAYMLHEPMTTEIERLQEQQIITPLRVGKTAEWCKLPQYYPNPMAMYTYA